MHSQAAPKDQRTLSIAHRGASGYAPEHTMPAYDLALKLGADYIEQDLQMTSDGILVVMHDQSLERTARGPAENCTGLVISKTLEQIKTCDVGSWFNEEFPELAGDEYVGLQIPTLEEVFQRYGKKVRYYIETKTPAAAPGMEEELLRLLDKYGLREPATRKWQVLIQSFQPESLLKFHAMDPTLPLIQLGFTGGAEGLETIAEYAVGVGPSFGGIDEAYVEKAHSLCLAVHPYTVNEPEDIQRLIGIGVDGMFSNYPDVVRELGGPGKWSGAAAAAKYRSCRR
jgi:glycerophosphoryl diester phosphodiesterase